ncbi:UDP-N-acetylenolpyruvoylglucosamine reductase [Streptomyces laurentii]|uniref:UDP-N-acetylenolpyruvoylglucosamine reductase n=1 Tax=Streptomyces laurentii TaxID=39478 RepID=A0A160NX39_STRLU|nr:UDP-N-acetylenolpyruvoylglucosamine reductase [Streptomyces laurentii]
MGELLADYTTFRLGGPADQLLTHHDPDGWPDTVRAAGERPFILGGGSNILAADAGYRGTVIRMATRGITAHPVGTDTIEVTVQAGEPLSELVTYCVAEGLSGVEYLGGIPGTVGAAPVQNAGAYGQQIADHLTHVTAYDWTSRQLTHLDTDQCGFRYRSSRFKTEPGRWTILTVTLRLTRSRRAAPVAYSHLARALDVPLGARPPLAEAAAGVIADRRARGLTLPTTGPDVRQAGSIFMNPPVTAPQAAAVRAAGGPVHQDPDGVTRASAGWLLEHCGYTRGLHVEPGVACSSRRVLTLTARNGATASSVTAALQRMAGDVAQATGIELRHEPVLLHGPTMTA